MSVQLLTPAKSKGAEGVHDDNKETAEKVHHNENKIPQLLLKVKSHEECNNYNVIEIEVNYYGTLDDLKLKRMI